MIFVVAPESNWNLIVNYTYTITYTYNFTYTYIANYSCISSYNSNCALTPNFTYTYTYSHTRAYTYTYTATSAPDLLLNKLTSSDACTSTYNQLLKLYLYL